MVWLQHGVHILGAGTATNPSANFLPIFGLAYFIFTYKVHAEDAITPFLLPIPVFLLDICILQSLIISSPTFRRCITHLLIRSLDVFLGYFFRFFFTSPREF